MDISMRYGEITMMQRNGRHIHRHGILFEICWNSICMLKYISSIIQFHIQIKELAYC